jgi:hypothetical protein
MGYTHYYYMPKEILNDHWYGELVMSDGSIPMMHRQVDIIISEFISRYNTYVQAHPDTLAKVEVMELHTDTRTVSVSLDDEQKEIDSGLIVPNRTRYTFIHFNGIGDNAHESFTFPPKIDIRASLHLPPTESKYEFEFCKTANKPYDQCVTAFLLIAKQHLKDYIILKSDGMPEDWIKGNDMAGYNDINGMTNMLTADFDREVEQ